MTYDSNHTRLLRHWKVAEKPIRLTLVVALFTLGATATSSGGALFHPLLASKTTQGIGVNRSSALTKKEIVKTISEEIGLTQLKTKEIVQKTFDAIVETLVTEGRIELRNFGVFEVKKRAARRARNPRTGDKVSVPEKYVVTFKPGKEMEERVRQMEARETQEMLAQAHDTEPMSATGNPATVSSPTSFNSPPAPNFGAEGTSGQ